MKPDEETIQPYDSFYMPLGFGCATFGAIGSAVMFAVNYSQGNMWRAFMAILLAVINVLVMSYCWQRYGHWYLGHFQVTEDGDVTVHEKFFWKANGVPWDVYHSHLLNSFNAARRDVVIVNIIKL